MDGSFIPNLQGMETIRKNTSKLVYARLMTNNPGAYVDLL